MPIQRITISIPQQLSSFISTKVEQAGYGSVSEYFRELVRRDQETDLDKVRKAKAMAAARLERFGPAVRVRTEDLTKIRR